MRNYENGDINQLPGKRGPEYSVLFSGCIFPFGPVNRD